MVPFSRFLETLIFDKHLLRRGAPRREVPEEGKCAGAHWVIASQVDGVASKRQAAVYLQRRFAVTVWGASSILSKTAQ